MIWDRICSLILSPFYGDKFKLWTNSLAKSEGDILSLERSQSNLSFMTVFSSMGMSISTETSFLSSVSLLNPSLGRLDLYFCLYSLL